ncbi:MAG: carboxypeptidase regulatory-like domain-containing protein [Candidatus Magasanikbacteria bacterium]
MTRRNIVLAFLLLLIIGMGVGAFLFGQTVLASVGANFTLAPQANNTDNLIAATSANWSFTMTTTEDLARGDVVQFIFPTGFSGSPFVLTGVTTTATSGIQLYSALGASSANLMSNPSFETWDDANTPSSPWSFSGAGGAPLTDAVMTASTSEYVHGAKSLRLEMMGADSLWVSNVNTAILTGATNTTFTVSIYMKVVTGSPSTGLLIKSGGGGGQFFNFNTTTPEAFWGSSGDYTDISKTLTPVATENGWSRYAYSVPQLNTTGDNLIVMWVVSGASSTVLIDAAQIERNSTTTVFSAESVADTAGVSSGGPLTVFGYVGTTTVANGTQFGITLGGISNPLGERSSMSSLTWTAKAGTLANGQPGHGTLETEKYNQTSTSSVTRAGGNFIVDANTGIFLSNYTTGTAANYTFRFTPTSSVPVGGKIVIDFPSSYASLLGGISISTTQYISLGETSTSTIGAMATSTTSDSARRLSLTVSSTATVAGDPLSVTIYGVTNPTTADVYGSDSAGPGNRFAQFTAKSNNGLLDGSLYGNEGSDFGGEMGPPPPSSVTIGGKHTLNVLVRMNTATTTRNLTTEESAFMKVALGNPDKGYFIGSRRLDTNSSAQYVGLLDGTYMVGAELLNKSSATVYDYALTPGMRNLSLLSAAGTTVTTTIYFGIPDATTTIHMTNGVIGQNAYVLGTSANYQSFAPVYTTAGGSTPGFDADGNGYARVKVKSGESWSFNVMGGESNGTNTNFSSGTTKYWPPAISSAYIAVSGTVDLGDYAYVAADKTLTISLLYAGGSTPVTNACVGVKRSGGGMFMGAQDTICQPNSGNNYQFKVPAGAISISVSRPGAGQPAEFPVAISSNTTTKTIYLSGAENYINVTVQDSSGNAIRNASIFANGNGGFGQGMTGSAGTTTLYVPIGTYRVEGFAPGFGSLTAQAGVAVANGSNPSLTFTVNTGNLRTVTGQVTVGGSGLAGVKIGARGINGTNGGNGAETDSSGNYTLYLSAGTYEVGGWSPDTGGLSPQSIDVTAGNATGKNWVFSGGFGTVRINIDNSSNLSQLFAGVFNTSTGHGNGTDSWTASGTSKYANIRVPAGIYVVNAGSPVTGPIIESEVVTVVADETVVVSGNAQASVELITISGTVSLSAVGVQNINVWASRLGSPRFFSALTDASGNYTLHIPANGTYRLGVKTPVYIASEGDVNVTVAAVSSTGNNFTLVTTASSISGQITSGGSAVSNAWVSAKKSVGEVWSGAPTDDNGNYTLNVDNGTWTVYAEGPGYERSSGTSTVVADSATVNIALTARSGWSAPAPTMQSITDTSGGQISNANTTLDLPANALGANSSIVTVSMVSTTPRNAPNATALKNSTVSIAAQHSSGQAVSSLSSNATLSITLNADDLTELKVPESSLQFAYFDETSGQWEPMAATIDTVNHKVTVQTDHFTDFAPVIGGPDAPSGLTLATTTPGQINLSWSAPIATVTYYAVYATTTDISAFPTSTLLATTTVASYNHTGLTGGATWYYKVAGINDVGEGPNSDRATASAVSLGVPSGLSATAASASTMSLSWTAVSGATSYNVYRNTDSYTTAIGSPSTNSYSDSGLTAATSYSYKVSAVNSNGEGSKSDAVSATTNSSSSGSSGGGSITTSIAPVLGNIPASINGPTTVSTREINLNLSATGADYVAISENASFVGSAWLTYGANKNFVLSESSGVKKIYVKFRSATGGETAVQSVTVTYNAPNAPAVSSSSGSTEPAVSTVALNPDSNIAIGYLNSNSFQPGAAFKLTYTYTNTTGKVAKVKVVRQLVNSKNKVVKSAVANKSLKKGEAFTGKINEAVPSNLPAGDYTVKITIYDAKNKAIDQNSFSITVEKKKNKYFSLGEMTGATDIAFDAGVWAKIKTNVKMPASFKVKYSYINSTDAKHTVKMVRELIGPSGKAVQTKTGKWVMNAGEVDSLTFSQSLSASLPAGDYAVRIRAYDWTTKELLAENSFGFSVELK